jgi:hypothetical protein
VTSGADSEEGACHEPIKNPNPNIGGGSGRKQKKINRPPRQKGRNPTMNTIYIR